MVQPRRAAQTVACVEHLLAQLPPEATIGVVTPYAAQSTDLRRQLSVSAGKHGDRVRVGTVHTFQGGERDVMVLSLVAGRNEPPRCFDWTDRQPQLWNVAIIRARSNLIVVGDRELWRRRGGVGAELAAASATAPDEHGDDALRTRLYRHLHHDDPAVQLGVVVNGHLADARLSDGSAVLLDPGTASGRDPAVHLEQMLRRRRLLAGPDSQAARRIPAWTLDVGVNVDSRSRVGESWKRLMAAHALENDRGQLVRRASVEHTADLVQEMADAVANLDGLRLLAPAPRRPAFPERVTTYLEAEFPFVEPRAKLTGASGWPYRVTAAALSHSTGRGLVRMGEMHSLSTTLVRRLT